jgi:hypothetical protein
MKTRKILSGVCAVAGVVFVNGFGRRTRIERNAFDGLDGKRVSIWDSHRSPLGVMGELRVRGLELHYSAEIDSERHHHFIKQWGRGEFPGSSFHAFTQVEAKWDAAGVFDSVVRFRGIVDVGPARDPAFRKTSCSIESRQWKPVAISLPAIPAAVSNALKIQAAAAAGRGIKINGCSLSAATVRRLIEARSPWGIL